jgi:hypothetical protein
MNEGEIVVGYMHPGYAESLVEFGAPRELPQCGGWILERQIPGFPYRDAMGCYPLFCCQDWSQLHADLEGIGDELVSLALVTDPFGEYDLTYLQRCFEDTIIPFKEHFVVDLHRPVNDIVSKNRRKKARKALKEVCVEECQEPAQFIGEWVALYTTLSERHNITGIRAFSRAAFAEQLSIPGMVMLRAVYRGTTVGITLWFVQGKVGYGHLAAFNKIGYELRASYALDWFAFEFFSDKVRWLDLGAGAGITDDSTDGLSEYKRGWSTGTRTVYFCGRIFDRQRYAEIVKAKGIASNEHFPAYRKGEFA